MKCLVRSAALIGAIGPAPAMADCTDLAPSNALMPTASRPVTAEDLARLRNIGMAGVTSVMAPTSLAVSPEGRRISFILTRDEPSSNTICQGLFVLDLDDPGNARLLDTGGEPIPNQADVRGLTVTIGTVNPPRPQWSPDGTSLAYLRRDAGVTQLWLADTEGNGAEPLTSGLGEVTRFVWGKDGHSILLARRRSPSEYRSERVAEAARGFLYDDRFVPSRGHGLQPPADMPEEFLVLDIRSGDLRTARPEEVSRFENADRQPVGIVRDSHRPLAPARPGIRLSGSEDRICQWAQCEGAVAVFEDVVSGQVLYFRRHESVPSELGFYRWIPGRGEPDQLWSTTQTLFGCARVVDGLTCLSESARRPRQLAAIDIETGARSTLLDLNPEFAKIELSRVERLFWRNNRGLKAYGDFVIPSGPRPPDGWPMVVVQYDSDGFLLGGTGNEYPIFAFAARGIAALSLDQPNGVARLEPDLPDWNSVNAYQTQGWAERRSLLSSLRIGIDLAVERGVADPDRIGLTGLSDGATTVEFALINDGPFAAAAISTCCIDPESINMLGGPGYAAARRRTGYPALGTDDEDFWAPMSLARNAARIDTPLLMQLADHEYLLGLPAFATLQQQGKPVEMYVFPNENHNKWQPAHRLAIYERNLDWFDFWLRGIEDPDPSKAGQYSRWRVLRALE